MTASKVRESKSGGPIRDGERDLVYAGPYVKCYNIKFTRRSQTHGGFAIRIYVGSEPEYITSLELRESADVCEKKIYVQGWEWEGGGTGFWEATLLPSVRRTRTMKKASE